MSADHLEAHRFLSAPPWAGATRSKVDTFAGHDLSDLRGLLPAHVNVRKAARGFSPLTLSSVEQWTLRDALSRAHRCQPDQIIIRARPSDLWRSICRAHLDSGDRVALASPQPEYVTHEVLVSNARYVDTGRDQHFQLHREGIERLLEDGALRLLYLGRPSRPTGQVEDLEWARRGLEAGCVVVVDESDLHYADPMGGFPGPVGARSKSALTLLDDAQCDTTRLIIMRQICGLDGVQLSYAIGQAEALQRLWAIEPSERLPAALVGAGWLALDHIDYAREQVKARLACRDALRDALSALAPCRVVSGDGLITWVSVEGWDGADVAATLLAHGVRVQHNRHHTWREHVALAPPMTEDLVEVVTAFAALVS